MFRSWFSLLCLAPCLLTGCSYSSTSSEGKVAIVDLDEVANQLGLGEQWSQELTATQTNVNHQLVDFQQQLNNLLQEKKSAVTTNAGSEAQVPEEQKVQLVTYQQELNNKLRQAQTQAQQHINAERARIIQDYRQQAERISAKISQERGFDIVLTKNQSVVLTYTPTADITQEVTKRLRAELATQVETAKPLPPAEAKE